MNVNNINQLFQEKIQDINSRLPSDTNVNNKFQSLLSKAQLLSNNKISDNTAESATSTNTDDPVSLLKTMMATKASLNSTSLLFSSDTSSNNNMFPTSIMNNTINMLEQNILLKTLTKNESK